VSGKIEVKERGLPAFDPQESPLIVNGRFSFTILIPNAFDIVIA
jgi:hypothetical protein